MIIWVDDELFASNLRSIDLLCLLRNAATRRHTLLISNSPDDSIKRHSNPPHFSNWLHHLSDTLQWEVELLREKLSRITVNSVTRGRSKRILVTERPLVCHHSISLSLDDAVRASSHPLYILVENQINDSAFLRRVMPPYWRQRLSDWEKKGEIRFIQGGGIGELAKLVRVHAADDTYARLSFGLPADIWKQLHFVIYDHDGNTAQHPSNDSERVLQDCQANDMENNQHQLYRKKQENYVPQIAFTTIETRQTPLRQATIFFSQPTTTLHFATPNNSSLKKALKNFFKKHEQHSTWQDSWFEQDGSWPEMTHLAEKIASAM